MRTSKVLLSTITVIALFLSIFSSAALAAKPLVITDPSDGATVSGTYLVTGGGDGSPVEISIDYGTWEPADGGKSWTYSWDTTAYADGPYTLYARYTDGSDEVSVSVTVSNGGGGGDTCAVSAGEVVLNEVLPAPSSGSEWVELYNTTTGDLDIGNCIIDDLIDGGGSPYQIPAGTTIAAGGFWTVDFSSLFNNTGDDVNFLAEDGATVLDSYTYGSTDYDVSWYRSPDGGTWSTTPTSSPTKGTTNGGGGGDTCTVSAGEVVLNEVLPAPSSGSEWVELYNTTTGDLDIGNCIIDDLIDGGGSPYQIPAGTTIAAGGFWTVDFSSLFNNTGDDVNFLAEDGATVLDSYTYGSTDYDVSWYRSPDGGAWATVATSSPTKGTTNGGTSGECGTGTWSSGALEIHHINIGQGDATLIVGPTGRTLLFDAGESYWNSSADAEVVGPYIETVLGCKQLDYVLISHFHVDHIGYVGYGGLWNLVEVQGFTIGQTFFRDYNTYLGTTSGTFDNWKLYIEGDGQTTLNPTTAVEGSSQIDLGSGVVFDIIVIDGNGAIIPGDFSADTTPPSENDYSIGAILSYGDFDEWIAGDLDGEYTVSEYGYAYHDIELSAALEAGDVDVLRVNHHGSDHSTNTTFVNQLDPEVSIISVGDDNTYGHPRQPVMDLLLATSDVYMTERGEPTTNIGDAVVAGDIVIATTDGVNYTVNGTGYVATEPVRVDSDGDGYFVEVDPDDGDSTNQPAPNGGCDATYQYCSGGGGDPVEPPVITDTSVGRKSITVYWDTSQTVDYYNLYRSETSGGPYVLAEGNLPDNYYYWEDSGLAAKTTYYYVMTSVIGGVESGYSNEVSDTSR